ncbi:uncharacterized protein LOC128181258 [Crassostrea angulata]|uniref:uncharacterized protein LOC128181258 n=1 Tax=Magallana angulata TaxID=2784310 RepID=UPI0022B0BD8C|nr:uncharacterized protein LOC128181258 [Crassostrea angulata]
MPYMDTTVIGRSRSQNATDDNVSLNRMYNKQLVLNKSLICTNICIVDLPTETVVEGDCLICSKNISQITVRGVECNGNALGLCVSGDSVNSSSLFNGTFNAYWNTCKQNNKFITGNTHIVCQSESTWTGIRKYNIDTDNYGNGTTAVKAESPSLTLTKDTLVIILSVSGTTIAVCVFLLLCYRVLRERCRKPGTSHVHLDNIGQITHLNTQGQSRSKADSKAQNRYQTIVPNCGNDHCYDPIHKSEQESGPKFVIVQ